ncbi:MAG: hypothetical protein HC831_30220 [Chloroflexia bacterium]|nr:hypothetical protein [Chloroflexia bacterium]
MLDYENNMLISLYNIVDKKKLIKYLLEYTSFFEKGQPKNINLYSFYNRIGNYYWVNKEDYSKALEYFHKAALALLPHESNPDFYADLNYRSCISVLNLITALNNKGEAFYQLSKIRNTKKESLRDLKECYKNLGLSLDYMYSYKMQQTTEEQKYFYSNFTSHKYPNFIKVAWNCITKPVRNFTGMRPSNMLN